MSDKSKRIFLAICILVPFVAYCVFYYSSMISNAAYRFSDFESLELTFGTQDSMLNHFDSKTMIYQFVKKDNSLESDTLRFRKDDLLYLHRKAMEFGFWNVDDEMITPAESRNNAEKIPRYILQYNYKDKSKKVTLDADYPGNPKMKEAAKTTIDEVIKMLADVQGRN